MVKKAKTTKQRERMLSDLKHLGILGSGERDSLSASMQVGGRTFRWLSVGVEGVESMIQADYYAKTYTAKRRYIIELNEQTGEVIDIHAKQLTGFRTRLESGNHPWEDLAKEVGVMQEISYPHVFWLYWTPAGDEMMFGYRTDYGYFEGDGNWSVWMALRRLNPKVFDNHEIAPLLGSSEEEGTHVLLIEQAEPNYEPPIVYLAKKKFIYDYYGGVT